MPVQTFQFASEISRPAAEVFRWHERPGALERLTPPWEQVRVVRTGEGVTDGQRVVLSQKVGPLWREWEVEHRGYVAGKEFRDVAVRGPFASWEHRHRVVADGSASCSLIDEISYRLPAGALGKAVAGAWTRRTLERLFAFRHARIQEDLRLNTRYGAVRPMRFLISGASGLVGRNLSAFLRSQGHEIVTLVRRAPAQTNEVFWNPSKGELDPHALKAIDVVIHLAGANIAGARWSRGQREAIWDSRINGTRTLVVALEQLRHRPFAVVAASAIGFYGNRGDEELDETSARGGGFLADVCEAWEHEVGVVEELGIRPVMLRTGMVLSPEGGALGSLLPLFRTGLGGRLGTGRQWVSWISIDDLVGAYYHAVLDQRCRGPVNAVSAEPVRQAEFAQTLGRVLGRPSVLPAPAFALRAALGEMANELLLASSKVAPSRLCEVNYRFRHEHLEDALRFLLGRMA